MNENAYCLITGASRGIGAELAKQFARQGHSLVLVGRDQTALEQLKTELKVYPIDIKLFFCDLAQQSECLKLIDYLEQNNININILVNNAGLGHCAPFDKTEVADIMQMVAVNMSALTLLTRLLIDKMIVRKRGHILNVSSTAAFQPGPGMAVYYATKAYVLSFSQALHAEVKRYGVSVTTLCPGPTATEFMSASKLGSTRLVKLTGIMSSAKVAEIACQATLKGKRMVIPGVFNQILAISASMGPKVLVLKIMSLLNQRS